MFNNVVPGPPAQVSHSKHSERTMKILLVDDDEDLLGLLSFVIQQAGFQPITASDCSSALRLVAEQQPDLLVLDIRLGSDNGLEVLECIRRSSELPIILLSSLNSEADIERGLRLGADDYLIKPVSYRGLASRIRAVLRRTHARRPVEPRDPWKRVGPLALNAREHAATLDGLPLSLTRTEFRLLQVLMDNTGCVVEQQALLKQVWGCDDPRQTTLVRAAVCRLRQKLAVGDEGSMIRTVRGVGVVLEPPRESPVFATGLTTLA